MEGDRAAAGAADAVSITGDRGPSVHDNAKPATVVIYAPEGPAAADAPGAGAGSLRLTRAVLVGFAPAPPGAPAPLLWPEGLVPPPASAGPAPGGAPRLQLTDVRFVVDAQADFDTFLTLFSAAAAAAPTSSDNPVFIWTDNSTFVHVHQYTTPDGRTALRSVGVLLAAPPSAPNPLRLAPPLVKNALVAATNATLVPSLLMLAALETPAPLLVYLASNVSLGAHPPLPPAGVQVRRPLLLVGLASLVTSVDLGMVVNQLNQTGSPYSNVTFAGVVLENLAPGDAATSAVASPLSIAVVNNVWAAYYNRSAANDVRLALFNTTMVIPLTEASYVTYMFTLFTSKLPYLKQQTSLYSDVLHVTVLQFSPGLGDSAISVQRLKSWYHWWRDVTLTTAPQVAPPLPVPPRPLALSTPTRASPLVQAVRDSASLRAFAQEPVIGDRAHILLLISNASLAPPPAAAGGANGTAGAPITIGSPMLWMGTSREQAGPSGSNDAPPPDGASHNVWLSAGHAAGAVGVPAGFPADALQLQQMVLWQLPQGRGAAGAAAAAAADADGGGRGVPREVLTILMWAFDRPAGLQAINLNGLDVLVPEPELNYLMEAARHSPDFVVPLEGADGHSVTFQDVDQVDSGLHVASMVGPGVTATNFTLLRDPSPLPPGYTWPDVPPPAAAGPPRGAPPPWAAAVAAVLATLGAAGAAAGGYFVWARRRRAKWLKGEGPLAPLDVPPSYSQSLPRHSDDLASAPAPAGARLAGGGGGGGGSSGASGSAPAAAAKAGGCGDAGSGGVGTLDSLSVMYILPGGDNQSGSGGAKPGDAHGPPGPRLAGRSAAAAAAPRRPRPSAPAARGGSGAGGTGGTGGGGALTGSLHESVTAGLQRWHAAVSTTTLLLMERRMSNPAHGGGGGAPGAASSGSLSGPMQGGSAGGSGGGGAPRRSDEGAGAQDAAGGGGLPAPNTSSGSLTGPLAPQQLTLMHILGSGSFGSVWLAQWRGKKVAVKVMQLPADALLETPDASDGGADGGGGGGGGAPRRTRRGRGSAPHMAIMEAVLSSTMSHPNVVQVFTYYLQPTLVGSAVGSPHGGAVPGHGGGDGGDDGEVAGWTLKLVMEYCNEGSLRDALDCGLLCPPGSFLALSSVLALAHDVASAMMHLHSEGIVHGDLKAHNVLLTGSSDPTSGMTNGRMWAAGGSRRLTAKVGDFGLALPLQPADTHATMAARGTPSHMSPELFMSGHVSKASDVYAFGILLYEMMTGRRAYAGVPLPLLPHEVARQGLRPEWPSSLPPGCKDLQRLADLCWAHLPQDRPTFVSILAALDWWMAGNRSWPAALGPAPAGAGNSSGSGSGSLSGTFDVVLRPASRARGQPAQAEERHPTPPQQEQRPAQEQSLASQSPAQERPPQPPEQQQQQQQQQQPPPAPPPPAQQQ